MKKMMIGIFAALCVASAADAATFLLAGDSTLDDYGRKPRPPYASWGTALEKSMKPGCKVDNYAKGGRSTKSFIAGGYWAKLVAAIKPGDFVGIQFGHNDQKWSTPIHLERCFADPNGLFRENVRKFVAEVRAKDGEPAKDVTHPIAAGAEAFAKLFIEDVKARNLEVATLFQ